MEVSELVNFWLFQVFRAVILVFGVLAAFWIIGSAVLGGSD
jgi:hypothetical protein